MTTSRQVEVERRYTGEGRGKKKKKGTSSLQNLVAYPSFNRAGQCLYVQQLRDSDHTQQNHLGLYDLY
jgi:hypothetical protein